MTQRPSPKHLLLALGFCLLPLAMRSPPPVELTPPAVAIAATISPLA